MAITFNFSGSLTIDADSKAVHSLIEPIIQLMGNKASELALSVNEGGTLDADISYGEFWQFALQQPGLRGLFPNNQPVERYYMTTAAAPRGAMWVLAFTRDRRARAEYYIDLPSQEGCKVVFDTLYGLRNEIEGDFGGSLSWERLDARKASRISATVDIPEWRDRRNWPEIVHRMEAVSERLRESLRPRLTNAHVEAIQRAIDGGRLEEAIQALKDLEIDDFPEVRD